jgi:dihydrofolate reductase
VVTLVAPSAPKRSDFVGDPVESERGRHSPAPNRASASGLTPFVAKSGDPITNHRRQLMRKVIESTLVSLDGVIGDPQVWANEYFDDEATALALEQLLITYAMLMGRRTYEMVAATWPGYTSKYAETMNNIRKYVFSSTLETTEWSNSEIISDDPAHAVAELKQQGDGDLVLYGHGPLAQALLEQQLLDELRLWIHPLLIGQGTLLFREGASAALHLATTQTLASGVVILTYKSA